MRGALASFLVLRTAPRETSAALLDCIRAHPGAAVGQLVEKCQLAAGTVYYHLGRLERDGTIRTIVAGGRRLVFLASDVAAQELDPHALSLLRGRTAAAVAKVVIEHAPLSIVTLIARVRGSPRAVYYHVKRMKAAGLIDSAAPRRYRALRPTPKLLLVWSALPAVPAAFPADSRPSDPDARRPQPNADTR